MEKTESDNLELSDILKIIVQISGIKQGGCLEPWKESNACLCFFSFVTILT